MIFHLRKPRARRFPFLFELPLPRFKPRFFHAQTLKLPRQFFALRRQSHGFCRDRSLLLSQRHFAAFKLRALFRKPRRESFRCAQPLVTRRKFRPPRRQFVLFRLHRSTQLRQFVRQPRAFGFRFRAARRRSCVLILSHRRAPFCAGYFLPQSRKFALANRQLQPQPRKLAMHLLMLVRRANHFALSLSLLRRNALDALFSLAQRRRHALHLRLHFLHARFKQHHFRV